MTGMRYPDTPAGRSRRLRDADDEWMTRLGHSVKWKRGHGQAWLKGVPGWTGRCTRCGDVLMVADLDGGVFRLREDANGKTTSMRKCARRRR